MQTATLPFTMGLLCRFVFFLSNFSTYLFIFYVSSYLKYYNAPLIEISPITNLRVMQLNGLTSITFERELIIQSINNPTSIFDMRQNNYIAIGTGNLVDGVVQTHTEYPVFSNASYNLTKMYSIQTLLNSGPDLSGPLANSNNSTTPAILPINSSSIQTYIDESTTQSIYTSQVTSDRIYNFSVNKNLMETSSTQISATSSVDVTLMSPINESVLSNYNLR